MAEEELVNQVLDEIGINLAADLADAPTARLAEKTPARPVAAAAADASNANSNGEMDDLAARLNNLRK